MCNTYKMIIVDDECCIRESLLSLFNWASLGFKVCGCFEDYESSLQYIQHNPVSVLLTDIRLGSQLGIDLVREAQRIRPKITSVLISAYSEFDYAREAISLNVFEYLLKPISFADIEFTFSRLHDRLDSRSSTQRDRSQERPETHASNAYYICVAKAYIDKHLCDNLTLEIVASQLSLNAAYLSRYFKQQTGEKFIDYLSRMRIQKAKELLADPSVKLSGIHHLVGYQSRSQFYSVFSQYSGYTPADFRNRLLNPGG